MEKEKKEKILYTPPTQEADVSDLAEDYVIDEGFQLQEVTPESQDAAKRRAQAEVLRRQRAAEHKKAKKKGCLSALIWIGCIVIVSVGLAATLIVGISDYLGLGKAEGAVVTVEQGMSTSQIASALKEAGVIRQTFLFRVYSKLKKYDGTYQYGTHTFNSDDSYGSIVTELQTERSFAAMVKVQFLELSTIDSMAQKLEESGVCSAADFKTAVRQSEFDFDFVDEIPVKEVYYRLEGYIFPDTYLFYDYGGVECAEQVIIKGLKELNNKFTPQMRQDAQNRGYSFHQIMTLASIVELEAGGATYEEKQQVAAVFYNRLEGKNWNEPKYLGSSPTKLYPYGNGRYNTYKTEGLPPGPVCSPGEDSIKAAVYPAANCNATYFVTDKDMKYYFNESYEAHNATIRRLKNQGKWVGDGY